MMVHTSNVSLCLGLQSGDLKHVMKRLKTSKTDHIPGNVPRICTIAKCGYLYQAFGIQVNDGMYIAPERVKIW
jgi:predicted metalloendopeptidase